MNPRPSDEEMRAEIDYRNRRIKRKIDQGLPIESTFGDRAYIAALEWVLGIDEDLSDD